MLVFVSLTDCCQHSSTCGQSTRLVFRLFEVIVVFDLSTCTRNEIAIMLCGIGICYAKKNEDQLMVNCHGVVDRFHTLVQKKVRISLDALLPCH